MLYLLIKAAISGLIIAIASEVARRSPALGALVIALPLAYVGARRWLEGFAYKADLDPALFAVAAGLALATALAAVSVQTWRAATADPVHALRSE